MLAARPMCESCRRRPSAQVDHVRALAAHGAALDVRNLRAVCASCHSRKTAARDGGFGRRPTPPEVYVE